MDLFVPSNLDLHEDGSVTPHNFTKDLIPFDSETISEYNKRYLEATKDLKPYERGMWIPYDQERKLYKVIITYAPKHLTQKEIDECLQPQVYITKFFLEKETALTWAKNKIKQQSIACYYNKNNKYHRQYVCGYTIIHGSDDVIEGTAINGKIVKKVEYGL